MGNGEGRMGWKRAVPLAALSCLGIAGIAYACARALAVDAALARLFELSRRGDEALSLRMDGLSEELGCAERSLSAGLRGNAAQTRGALAALGERMDRAVSGLALAKASPIAGERGRGDQTWTDFAADHRVIADSLEAEDLYRKEDYLAAAAKYRAVTEALPLDAEARLFLAASLYRSGRRTLDCVEEMKRCLAAAQSVRGEDPLALEIKAGLLAEEGAWAPACAAYAELEAKHGLGEGKARRTGILRLYGTALLNAGRATEAARRFDQARAETPEDASLLFLAGEAYSASGERITAAERYASCYALDEREQEAALRGGEAFMEAGKYAEAESLLARCARVRPSSLVFRELARARAALALAAESAGAR